MLLLTLPPTERASSGTIAPERVADWSDQPASPLISRKEALTPSQELILCLCPATRRRKDHTKQYVTLLSMCFANVIAPSVFERLKTLKHRLTLNRRKTCEIFGPPLGFLQNYPKRGENIYSETVILPSLIPFFSNAAMIRKREETGVLTHPCAYGCPANTKAKREEPLYVQHIPTVRRHGKKCTCGRCQI